MDRLSDIYVDMALRWSKAMSKGASSSANSLHDNIQDLYDKMDDTQKHDVLSECADHENDSVRFWAASHLKHVDIQHAIKIYDELTLSSLPYVALPARYILRELLGTKGQT